MAAYINMRLDKNEMPSQDPQVRNKNFLEVALGYTEEQAFLLLRQFFSYHWYESCNDGFCGY